MRGSAPLSNEGYSLVLDIYLGGVSGALMKNGVVEHSVHQKLLSLHTPTTSYFLQNIDALLHKVLDELAPKQTISKTLVSIDPPFSYVESSKVLFQKNDKTFFETKYKEIFDTLELPVYYQEVLQDHALDGAILEHPPHNHTINGYTTQNIHLEGERVAIIDQQWIQGNVYHFIQKIKSMYALGQISFISTRKDERGLVLKLGDYVSTLQIEGKNIIIATGVQKILQSQAKKNSVSVSQIQSLLKGIARGHSVKDEVYRDIINDVTKIFAPTLKSIPFSDHKHYNCTYVGESYMLPVIQDVFSVYKNISFSKIYKGVDARLIYIEKISYNKTT